jgi:uncharacterized protein YidB (DUF937 family)
MSILDSITSALKGVVGQGGQGTAAEGPISTILGKIDFGDLQGLVAKLQQGGLNEQVQSWLGNGANLPVTADQLRAALGSQQVQEVARRFGLPVDVALKFLSEHLPTAVDHASPNGTLEPDR